MEIQVTRNDSLEMLGVYSGLRKGLEAQNPQIS